jgi:hypothetical protein
MKLVLRHMKVRKTQVMNSNMKVLATGCFRNHLTSDLLFCSSIITYYNPINPMQNSQSSAYRVRCGISILFIFEKYERFDADLLVRVLWYSAIMSDGGNIQIYHFSNATHRHEGLQVLRGIAYQQPQPPHQYHSWQEW